ncbi:hypothetical protein ACFZC3_06415 [Streptomyces sp. NPDC007903]|uniref:hypothetical protein n=1 Tax=Streptomyces sp. NPDC007903 TaxID=3364786 RepID=UPI0036E288EB
MLFPPAVVEMPGALVDAGAGTCAAASERDTEMDGLREQGDAALAAGRQAEIALQALRNVNQRLMVENSWLIAPDALDPTRRRTEFGTDLTA